MDLTADEFEVVTVVALDFDQAEAAAVAAICRDDTTIVEIVTNTRHAAGRYRIVARTRQVESLPAELAP